MINEITQNDQKDYQINLNVGANYCGHNNSDSFNENRTHGNKNFTYLEYTEQKKSRNHKCIQSCPSVLNKLAEYCINLGMSLETVWRDYEGTSIIFTSNGHDGPLSDNFTKEGITRIAKRFEQNMRLCKNMNKEKQDQQNTNIQQKINLINQNIKESCFNQKYENYVNDYEVKKQKGNNQVMVVFPKANNYKEKQCGNQKKELIGDDNKFERKNYYIEKWYEGGNDLLPDNVRIYNQDQLGINLGQNESENDKCGVKETPVVRSASPSEINTCLPNQVSLGSKKIKKQKTKENQENSKPPCCNLTIEKTNNQLQKKSIISQKKEITSIKCITLEKINIKSRQWKNTFVPEEQVSTHQPYRGMKIKNDKEFETPKFSSLCEKKQDKNFNRMLTQDQRHNKNPRKESTFTNSDSTDNENDAKEECFQNDTFLGAYFTRHISGNLSQKSHSTMYFPDQTNNQFEPYLREYRHQTTLSTNDRSISPANYPG